MILVVLMAAALRLLPHEPNMVPIAALALFGGVNFSKKQALVVPFLAMLVSDFFLGWHTTMPWVYGSFLITILLGFWLKRSFSWKKLLGFSLLSSVLFYLITNFGVWFSGTMYPKTVAGLVQCYYMGLPFFRNTVVGDFGYNFVFFGGHVLATFWSRDFNWATKLLDRDSRLL